MLSSLIMHAADKLPREQLDEILSEAKKNGGMSDVRLVINGVDIPYAAADKLLADAWRRSVEEHVQAWIGSKLDVLTSEIRETITERVEAVLTYLGRNPDGE